MASTIATLRNYIYSQLQTLTKANKVYNYQPSKIEGYPTIVLLYEGMPEAIILNRFENTRIISFAVRVEQEIDGIGHGAESGENVFIDLIDEILTLFDNDTTLGGNAIKCSAITGESGYAEHQNNLRVAKINLQCLTLVSASA